MTKHKFKFTKRRKRFKHGGWAKEGRQEVRNAKVRDFNKQIQDYINAKST